MMRPVNHATTVIPLIATTQCQRQTLTRRYAPSQVNIMCDQYAVTVIEFENKFLVARSFIIISQHTNDTTAGFKPNAGALRRICQLHGIVDTVVTVINPVTLDMVVLVERQPQHHQHRQQPVSKQ